MFCDNCGAAVESGSKFCDSCGKALDVAVKAGQSATALGPREHLDRRWRKPILIVAVSAVAATAAVTVYQKVSGSLTADSSKTQKSPGTSALDSVKAAIAPSGSYGQSGKGSGSSAQSSLSELPTDRSKNLNRSTAAAVLATSEIAHGRKRVGQLTIGPEFTGVVSKCPYSELLQLGLISTTGPYRFSDVLVVSFTAAGQRDLLNSPQQLKNASETPLGKAGCDPNLNYMLWKEGQCWEVTLATPELIEVTGITTSGNSAHVEYTWKWKPTAIAMRGRFQRSCERHLQDEPMNFSAIAGTDHASFTLYDDGWRLDPPSPY